MSAEQNNRAGVPMALGTGSGANTLIAAECWARKRFLGLMADVDQTTAHSVLIASSQVNQVT